MHDATASRPAPPPSSGIVTPIRPIWPSSRRSGTLNVPDSSCAIACGSTRCSANWRTVLRISSCSSDSIGVVPYHSRSEMSRLGIERWLKDQPAVLVANPTAHSGKAADTIRHARALLDEVKISHRFIPTEPEGATIERVREQIDDQGARCIIYMGGDGTFAEV